MINEQNMYRYLERLVSVPSVSGTKEERLAAEEIISILMEMDYFKQKPENVKKVLLKDDPLNRFVPFAFVEGKKKSKKTILLTGHYDVVGVEEFGHLKDQAYSIEEIGKRIKELPLTEDCLKDLESGDWLFGRGTADMKYGISLCLALVDHFSQADNLDGNLLFFAVPGEETTSEGMLSAVAYLYELEKEKHLDYIAMLLTECYLSENPTEDKVHKIHIGSSGKVMPMFFCTALPSHVGEPFEGFDPNFMLTQINQIMHLNPEFCESLRGETTPPPIALKQQDLKEEYSASIPNYAVAYYNFITLAMDPANLMKKLTAVAEAGFDAAIKVFQKRLDSYEKLCGRHMLSYPIKPCVMSFHEFYLENKKIYGEELDLMIQEVASDLIKKGLGMQDAAVQIMKALYDKYPDKKPMIIVGFIPPFYPDAYPDEDNPNSERLLHCVNRVIDHAKQGFGQELEIKNYFMGISDASYTGLNKRHSFDVMFENLVGNGQIYTFPMEGLRSINIPSIVLGGYGKDLHKHSERLNYSYNFNVLPFLYERIIEDLLSGK